jgi:hypothetical protein
MKNLFLLIALAVFTANLSASTSECFDRSPKKHKKYKKNNSKSYGCKGMMTHKKRINTHNSVANSGVFYR